MCEMYYLGENSCLMRKAKALIKYHKWVETPYEWPSRNFVELFLKASVVTDSSGLVY